VVRPLKWPLGVKWLTAPINNTLFLSNMFVNTRHNTLRVENYVSLQKSDICFIVKVLINEKRPACVYKATLRRVHSTIVAVENQ
jgi:hypothetical protein